MPIYEYHCPRCGEFEVTQRITEEALKRCPTCRSKVKKLISQTSFQLKGSGWYITDYARQGNGGGRKDTADSTGSTDSKADAKPQATKTESTADASPSKGEKKAASSRAAA